MSEQAIPSGGNAPSQAAPSAGQQPAIDIAKLAEKVYQLMRADARLARIRGQARIPGR